MNVRELINIITETTVPKPSRGNLLARQAQQLISTMQMPRWVAYIGLPGYPTAGYANSHAAVEPSDHKEGEQQITLTVPINDDANNIASVAFTISTMGYNILNLGMWVQFVREIEDDDDFMDWPYSQQFTGALAAGLNRALGCRISDLEVEVLEVGGWGTNNCVEMTSFQLGKYIDTTMQPILPWLRSASLELIMAVAKQMRG